MNQEILDHTLHSYLHKLIDTLPADEKVRLKTLQLCGSKVVPQKGMPDNVYLMSNGNYAKFVGQTMCKNTWACPVCSAYMMSKYASEIAEAIEVMKSKGYVAFMMTLSIPHLRFMSCRTVTDILFETFSYFRRTAKQKNYQKKKDGSFINKAGTVSKQFFQALGIKYYVNVCEYTWGVNGWHPHFHMLLWTKKENLSKIMEWQGKLNEFWLHTARRITVSYFKKHFTDDFAEDYTNRLYVKGEEGAGCYISNDNGVVRESLTSDYVSGWGADKELTGNRRKEASHDGHYTPYQILEKAYYGDKKMESLYLEFCLQVTRKPVHHRVLWSKNGFKKMVKQNIQSLKAVEYLKKKESADAEWKVVCFFTSEQWSEIYYRDKVEPIKANLLFMALNAPEMIPKYLDSIGIPFNKPDSNCRLVENLFNQAA